jgi:hypothetical protein
MIHCSTFEPSHSRVGNPYNQMEDKNSLFVKDQANPGWSWSQKKSMLTHVIPKQNKRKHRPWLEVSPSYISSWAKAKRIMLHDA